MKIAFVISIKTRKSPLSVASKPKPMQLTPNQTNCADIKTSNFTLLIQKLSYILPQNILVGGEYFGV